jgi:hypothetical protein
MIRNILTSNKFFLSMFLGAILVSSLFLTNCSDTSNQVIAPSDNLINAVSNQSNPEMQAVMAVQNRHASELMSNSNIAGIGTGLNSEGKPTIFVFSKYELTDKSKRAAILGNVPNTIEGKPVEIVYTGEFKSFALTGRYRPVPIGVSTGNTNECSAGTIGCIVRDGSGQNYMLSCNHVFALENTSPANANVAQPGLYDTRCRIQYSDQVVGHLANYVPIDFAGYPNSTNTIDAALAICDVSSITFTGKTSSSYYGSPNTSSTQSAYVNLAIKKLGRTTSLTTGRVTYVNVTVDVGYSSGTARFVNQIMTTNRFCKAGDSGSLVVTNDGNNLPVGLLFAGTSAGSAVLNPIDAVLNATGYWDVTVWHQ